MAGNAPRLSDGTLILVLEWDGWVDAAGKRRWWPSLDTVEAGKLAKARKREHRPLALRCYVVPSEFAGLGLDSLVTAADGGALLEVNLEHTRSVA